MSSPAPRAHLAVRCPVRDATRVAEALTARGWGTLWIDEPLVQHTDAEGYVLDAPPPDAPAVVHAWPSDSSREPLPAAPSEVAGYAVELVPDPPDESAVDWSSAWRAEHAERVPIDDEWALLTPWAERAPGEHAIVIEPGGAFGTGAHATTRDSLALLRACLRERAAAGVAGSARVLDLGTGSGVLAVAAKVWGAGEVLANDLADDTAAHVAGNARLNALDEHAVQVVVRDMRELAQDLARDATAPRWDVVLCNVGAAEVASLLPAIPALLAPAGAAIASGVFAPSRARIEALARALGLRVADARASDDGWVTLVLRADA